MEENVEIINLPGVKENISSILDKTVFSLGVYPSFSEFVESLNNKSTPSSPIRANLVKSISLYLL